MQDRTIPYRIRNRSCNLMLDSWLFRYMNLHVIMDHKPSIATITKELRQWTVVLIPTEGFGVERIFTNETPLTKRISVILDGYRGWNASLSVQPSRGIRYIIPTVQWLCIIKKFRMSGQVHWTVNSGSKNFLKSHTANQRDSGNVLKTIEGQANLPLVKKLKTQLSNMK